jgi:gas vesicle protein
MNNGKFSNGFLLGLIIGGGAVFLLATETGRNLMKIVSERGMDGIAEILEEYNFEGSDEMEDEGEISAEDVDTYSEANHHTEDKLAPKKHFFKRVRK